MEEPNPELETFRQQWRAEVSARAQAEPNKATKPKATRRPPPITSLSSNIALKPVKEDEDHVEPQKTFSLDGPSSPEEHARSSSSKEPQSALDHYEKAVERESQGSLGESLDLYRKAFRVSYKSLQTDSANGGRWIIELIKNTRTNTSHPHISARSPQTQTPPTQQSQCLILPTTP